jgi:hypothetical protein
MLYGILSIGYSCSHGLARTQNNQYNARFPIICSYHFNLTSFHIHYLIFISIHISSQISIPKSQEPRNTSQV